MERRILLKIITYVSAMTIGAGIFAGCGQTTEPEHTQDSVVVDTNVGSMEDNPVLEYDKPVQLPGIIVDRAGYSSQEVKYAWVVAEEMPATFSIVNDESGETVLTAEPEVVRFDSNSNTYSAKVKFSDVVTSGSYHIEETGLGKSYSFCIEEDYYVKRFSDLLDTENAKFSDMTITVQELYSLIYIYERYPGSMSDEDCRRLWENIGGWLSKADLASMDKEGAAMLAALFAKASYNFREYSDAATIENSESWADDWSKQSEALYKELEEHDGELDKATEFVMLAELYRITGNRIYGNKISDMYEYISELEEIHTSRMFLYGSMCYMTTRKTVNRNLCDLFMQSLLMGCEDISMEKNMLAPQNPERTDTAILLDYAQQLIAMNYILDGYQYNELVVSIVHYMSGRNYEGYMCDIESEYPEDSIVILAWLSLLEKNGKLDPSAPVVWEYSW